MGAGTAGGAGGGGGGASCTLKSGSDYADLKVVDGKDFSPEQYGIALRKDSPETLKKLNDAIQAVADDGTLDKIAEKYSLQDLLLVKKK